MLLQGLARVYLCLLVMSVGPTLLSNASSPNASALSFNQTTHDVNAILEETNTHMCDKV